MSKILLSLTILAAVIPLAALSGGDAPRSSPSPCWSDLQNAMVDMHHSMERVLPSGDCDEEFVRLMLPHHQAAVDMARSELARGKDPALKRLAQEIITDQQSEIGLMQRWLARKNDHQAGNGRNQGGSP